MVVPRAMYLKFQDGPFSVRTTHGWLAYPVAGTCKCIPWKWLCHRERLVNSTMALSQVQYVFSLTEVLVHSSTVSNRQALHPIEPFRTPRRATLPKWSPVHGLDECNHHHYGCSREACGGGLHSMAHGYATVRVNSQSDALYCPGYSRGYTPSFDRSYFERITTPCPLSANTVYIYSSSCGNNAPRPHSEMCHMWRLTLVIFRGSNGSVSSRQCRVSHVSRGP